MFSAYTHIHLEENLSVWHVALVLRCSLHTHTFIWKKISVSDTWRYCSDVLYIHTHSSGRKSQCLTRGVSAQMFSAYTHIHLEENLSLWHVALLLRCSLHTHTHTFMWKRISVQLPSDVYLHMLISRGLDCTLQGRQRKARELTPIHYLLDSQLSW